MRRTQLALMGSFVTEESRQPGALDADERRVDARPGLLDQRRGTIKRGLDRVPGSQTVGFPKRTRQHDVRARRILDRPAAFGDGDRLLGERAGASRVAAAQIGLGEPDEVLDLAKDGVDTPLPAQRPQLLEATHRLAPLPSEEMCLAE